MQLEYIDCGGNSTSNALDIVAYKGLSEEFIGAVSHLDANSPNFRAAALGEARYGQYSEIGLQHDPIREREGLRALASIPILAKGQLISLLNVASHQFDTMPRPHASPSRQSRIRLAEACCAFNRTQRFAKMKRYSTNSWRTAPYISSSRMTTFARVDSAEISRKCWAGPFPNCSARRWMNCFRVIFPSCETRFNSRSVARQCHVDSI